VTHGEEHSAGCAVSESGLVALSLGLLSCEHDPDERSLWPLESWLAHGGPARVGVKVKFDHGTQAASALGRPRHGSESHVQSSVRHKSLCCRAGDTHGSWEPDSSQLGTVRCFTGLSLDNI
jgi:hypothetical protein